MAKKTKKSAEKQVAQTAPVAVETTPAITPKLIVAQRVTSVMDADLILVMDDGAVVAQGTHEELMKTCEIYREVYESQQEGVSIGG